MQQAHRRFQWHHRRKYGTAGRLWHDRFQHEAMAAQQPLRVGYQIEQLPVNTGLMDRPADYPYSSYAHYALSQHHGYLDSNPAYVALAITSFHRQDQYRRLGVT